MAQVVETRKLDFELLDRWIKYMAKPTEKYKNKEAWQAMMKKPASTAAGGQETRRPVPGGSHRRRCSTRNEIDEENKVIADKALEGTKPKKRTNKPSNFVIIQRFLPGLLAAAEGAARGSEQLLDRDLPARVAATTTIRTP